jgi:Flp pilus assembly protein TadG
MASMIVLHRGWRSERGAQLVEFALVLPVLLLIILGIAEFGLIFQRLEVVTNAAREGARIAVLPGYGTADVQSRVAAYMTAGRVPTTASPANPTVAVANWTVTLPGGTTLAGKRVTVTYTHTFLFVQGLAGIFGGSFTTVPLVAVSEMRTEAPPGS